MTASPRAGALGATILALSLMFCREHAFGETKQSNGQALVARVVVDPTYQTQFRADIVDAPIVRNGERLLNWTLTIRCVRGCGKSIVYTENTSNHPIAAFSLRDDSPQIITYWTGGSAGWVRIYEVSTTGIKKIFDQATRNFPQIAMAEDGSPVIILGNRDDPHPEGTFETHGQIWQWDGDEYRLVNHVP